MSDRKENEASASKTVLDSCESNPSSFRDTQPDSLRNSSSDSKLSETRSNNSTPQIQRYHRPWIDRDENLGKNIQHTASYTKVTNKCSLGSTDQSLQRQQQQQRRFSDIGPSISRAFKNSSAAVENTVNMSSTLPNFSMDPYFSGLIEHESERAMPEEKYLTPLNMQKQHPKNFKCPYCDKAFIFKCFLKQHTRKHTSERPFKCDFEGCGKAFKWNQDLKQHKQIHSSERPFKCNFEDCGMAFKQRPALTRHKFIHTRKRQYQSVFKGTDKAFSQEEL